MTYSTQADMETRFGTDEIIQLTDRALPPTGVVVVAVLDQALADAGAEIDGYLQSGGYALPLATVPPILVGVACDLARFRLYDNVVPEAVGKRRDDARRFLEQLAAGKIRLGAPEAAPPSGGPAFSAPSPVFAGKLDDYV